MPHWAGCCGTEWLHNTHNKQQQVWAQPSADEGFISGTRCTHDTLGALRMELQRAATLLLVSECTHEHADFVQPPPTISLLWFDRQVRAGTLAEALTLTLWGWDEREKLRRQTTHMP